MAERRDRRRDKAKRIEKLVTVEPGSLGDYALRYLQDLEVRNYSPHTVRHAGIHVRLFLVWCEERGLTDPADVTLSTLRRYRSHLFHYRKADGRRLSFQSQSDRLGGMRRFFTWMAEEGHLAESPAAKLGLPRVEKKLPRGILSADEAEAVLAQPDVDTPSGLRDRAMIEVLYATGIRRGEIEQLRVEDFDFDGGVLRVVQGKGKKDRLVPLSERAAAWVEKYFDEVRPMVLRGRDPGRAFLGRWGRPLGGGHIGKVVRQHVQASGIGKDGSCHMFRHTMATLMLEGGADIRYIQKMLGHATLQSTEIYTHVAIRKLKEVHEQTHPAAKLSRRQRRELGDELLPDPREELFSSLAAEAALEEAQADLEGAEDVEGATEEIEEAEDAARR